jgi:hypothetical protein
MHCKKQTPDLSPAVVKVGNRCRQESKCACGCKKNKFIKNNNQEGGREIDVKLSNEAYQDKPADEIDGYKLDTELSKPSGKILTYHNPEKNDTIFAYRGTRLSDKNDLLNAGRIFLGTFEDSNYVKNGIEITKKAEDKYKGSTFSHTGHSKGGTAADIVAGKFNNHDAYLYNPGASPIGGTDYKKTKGKRELNITGVDPISVYSIMNPKGLTLHWPKSLNPHSLSNFK